MDDRLARARAALDQAHAADPARLDGRPSEQVWVERVGRWVQQLAPKASDALILAAHAQHLERWSIPRASFPLDRPGYHKWRRAVHARQGERARELLVGAGCEAALAERVQRLVAKEFHGGDVEGQTLEDAACLAFLESELTTFAAEHGEYTREKLVAIVRKTWAKMSPAAHRLALGIALPPHVQDIVREAVTPPRDAAVP